VIQDGPLLRLSRQLEEATDAYTAALDAEAEAENAYLKCYAAAFTIGREDGLPVTILDKASQVAATDERTIWNRCVARTKACRAKISELEHRLSAGQSHLKYLGIADGNGR
jgi:hypothetical protein